MPNAILLLSNNNFAHFTIACINSIKSNYPNHPQIFLFSNTPLNNHFVNYLKNNNISILPNLSIPSLSHFYTHKDVPSTIVYYKYILFSDIFNDFDTVLYLDSDTIILQPLDDLFSNNFFITYNNLNFKEIKILPDNLLPNCLNKKMVNAGVIAVPKYLRSKYYLSSIINITNYYNKYLIYADQSALSLFCLKHNLSPSNNFSFNFQPPLYTKLLLPRYKNVPLFGLTNKKLLNNIKILHFSGPIKPTHTNFKKWTLLGTHANILLNTFFKYYDTTKIPLQR